MEKLWYVILIFSDIASRGIVEVVGDDVGGRKIIVISACRLPCNKVCILLTWRWTHFFLCKELFFGVGLSSLSSNICKHSRFVLQSFNYDRFLQYLTHTLETYVKSDYSLVYFHHGLTSKNKPTLRWLWEAYKQLERPYKKNLKSMFLVHPTRFIRVVYAFFKPLIR